MDKYRKIKKSTMYLLISIAAILIVAFTAFVESIPFVNDFLRNVQGMISSEMLSLVLLIAIAVMTVFCVLYVKYTAKKDK